MIVTVAQVKEAVETHQIESWRLRSCSMCNYPLRYLFLSGSDVVMYDTGCECTNFSGGPEPRTYQDVAQCFNIQTNEEVAQRMWKEFLESGKKPVATAQ